MRLEILKQTFFCCRIHPWRPGRIQLFVLFLLLFEADSWDIDKFENLLESCRWIGIKIFAFEDEYLLPGEQVHPDFELINIDATSKVGKVAVIIANILLIAGKFFRFFAYAGFFTGNGLF